MLNDCTTEDKNLQVAMCAQFLEAYPQAPPSLAKVEELVIDNEPPFDQKHSPEV